MADNKAWFCEMESGIVLAFAPVVRLRITRRRLGLGSSFEFMAGSCSDAMVWTVDF